jgi:hypothetical protein
MKKTIPIFVILSFILIIGAAGFLASCTGKTANGSSTESTIGEFPDFSPDEGDFIELNIVQTIPPNGSVGIDPSTSISIFFDDEINPSTISDLSIKVQLSSGGSIYGTYSGEFDTHGNTILKFIPFDPLSENETVEVTLEVDGGIEDDGGNTLWSIYEFSFTTQAQTGPLSSNNFGFENGITGYVFSGDGAIIGTAGDIGTHGGSSMAAISTGDQVVSSNNALGDLYGDSTTSILTTGSISVPGGTTGLSFYYNFVSAEFTEWIGDEYDDTFLVTVTGSSSATSQVVTSVNMYTVEQFSGEDPVTLPAGFVAADLELNDAFESGWVKKEIDISSLGGQITVSFVISDVGDGVWTTILFLDDIAFE